MKKKVCECHLSFHTAQNSKCAISNDFVRVLPDDFPQEKYRSRGPTESKTTIHFGQRKLHLSEVEFLNIVTSKLDVKKQKVVMIYAGAAPGVHTKLLSTMFPFVEFVLVDPNPFKIKNEPPYITIYNEYFTDEIAHRFRKEYADYIRLFVSDIRTGDPTTMTPEEVENRVDIDMEWQQDWHKIMEPMLSMFKFRLPYVGDDPKRKRTKDYLDGDIQLQIWAPQSSSETRLIVKGDAGMKTYDCVKYENQLFRFNIHERVMCYPHDIINIPGIDCCYDCRAEIHVHEEYKKAISKINKLCEINGITYKGQKIKLREKSVSDYILELSKHVHANVRDFRVVYKGTAYSIGFTKIRYGEVPADILKKAKRL